MALVINDRVKETSTTSGTGTLNLAGATQDFITFVAGVGTTNTTYYCITETGTDKFEVGIGTVTDASTDTLIIGLSPDSNGFHDYSVFSGIPNNSGSGKTGDINFTTIGASSGDTYTVIVELLKTF